MIPFDGHQYLHYATLFGTESFGSEWYALRTPGFPGLLAVALALFGRTALAAQAVPLAVGVLGCLLVADSVRRIAGPAAAATTLMILGLFPTMVAFEHMILTESGTFCLLALVVRLGVWAPATRRAAWGRAGAFGIVLATAYLWRQTLVSVIPFVAGYQVFTTWRATNGSRRRLDAILQGAVVLLVPLAAHLVWWSYVPMVDLPARITHFYALRQGLVPPEDPSIAAAGVEYREALAAARDSDDHTGIPAAQAWGLADRAGMTRSGSASARWFVASAMRYPGRYLAAVGRTLFVCFGLDGERGESRRLRATILSPDSVETWVDRRPEDLAQRHRIEFARTTSPGGLRRLLAALRAPFDLALLLSTVAAAVLLVWASIRRQPALLALTGVPAAFAAAHVALLLSLDRYLVPIQPLLLACGVVTVWRIGGRVRRRFGKGP